MHRWLRVAGVALPGVLLAAAGLVHPTFLTPETARLWWSLHVWLVPVFPLVPLALLVVLRGTGGPVAQLARVAAYGFAVFYTALDVLAGIGAGLAEETAPGTPVVGRLFEVGDRLGDVGVWCLAVAGLLTGLALTRHHGPRVLGGTVVLVGSCLPFLQNHIFHPRGVLAVLGVALGTALLELARRPEGPKGDPHWSRDHDGGIIGA